MEYYVYVYLDPRKPGKYAYDEVCFLYQPFYVGKGKGKRWQQHLCNPKGIKSHKYNKIIAIRNSGLTPYIHKLYTNLTNDASIEHELTLIKMIGRADLKTGPLTNLTDGGDGSAARILSPESKAKWLASFKASTIYETCNSDEHRAAISKRSKAYQASLSDEERQKFSIYKRGENNPNYGKKISAEIREKMSASQKLAHIEGRKVLSEESRLSRIAKYSAFKTGWKASKPYASAKKYVLANPIGEVVKIDGAVRLQKYCQENKLQLQVLKKNPDICITEEHVTGTKIFARNTIGWTLIINNK